MKRLYKFIFCFCAWAFVSVPVFALNDTGADVKLMNDISKYIDEKPDVQAVNFCEHALQSNSIPLKSLASVILFKHFGDKYKSDFRKNFTIKKEIGNFEQDKQIFVGINNVGRLLEPLNSLNNFTKQFKRNDMNRLDGAVDYISLSITNMNRDVYSSYKASGRIGSTSVIITDPIKLLLANCIFPSGSSQVIVSYCVL